MSLALRARLPRLLIDVSPARLHRDYRLILLGQIVNNLGTEMTRIALPYQLYVLTNSKLALGVLASMQLAAVVGFSLLGGTVADAADRRRVLLCTQFGLCLVSSTMALLALTGLTQPWHLYVLAFLATALAAADRPARSSLVPRLVPPERLRSAMALNQAALNAARVVGPGLGGVVIATLGVTAAFGFDAISFTAALAALLAIAAVPPLTQAVRPGFKAIVEGLRYVRRAPVLLSAFAIDLDATILGMPVALFPVLALDVFHAGPRGLGLLASAPALGAVLGLLTSGWVARVHCQGRIVFFAVAVWGLAFTLFGLTTTFPLALSLLVVAGGADAISSMVRWTVIQLSTPDGLRGRVTSLNSMVVFGGPRLGDIESTTVAALTSTQLSVVSGGLACLFGVAAVWRWLPQLARYDSAQLQAEAAART